MEVIKGQRYKHFKGHIITVLEIAKLVVTLKGEIEKLREQIQNIE